MRCFYQKKKKEIITSAVITSTRSNSLVVFHLDELVNFFYEERGWGHVVFCVGALPLDRFVFVLDSAAAGEQGSAWTVCLLDLLYVMRWMWYKCLLD